MRLNKLSKSFLVFVICWTIYVIFRTSGYHTLLGHYFEGWNGDLTNFIVNLLLPPGVILAAYYIWRWINKDSSKPKMPDAIEKLKREMDSWPKEDLINGAKLMGALIRGAHDDVEIISKSLPLNRFTRIVDTFDEVQKSFVK